VSFVRVNSPENYSINEIISELEKIAENTEKTFGSLSAEQISRKPSATGWCVGQCFSHLIRTNELFYGKLDEIAGGNQKNSFLENWSPLSTVCAGLLIGSLKKIRANLRRRVRKSYRRSRSTPSLSKSFFRIDRN